MANAIWPNVAELFMMQQFVTAAGAPFVVHLFKNNFTPDQDSVRADFTEADFTGYTTFLWAVGSGFEGADDKAHLNPATPFFTGPTDLVPQDIYGWYATWPNASAEVFLAARFAGAPITMSSPADTITFNVDFALYDLHQ